MSAVIDIAPSAVELWSTSDFPYMCLKDRVRTEAFRRAIHEVVQPGDVVVDVGAGTGILSFFAAEAGAASVLSVEADPALAAALERSVVLNGLEDVVRVISGEVRGVDLPEDVDVVVAELVDTGLIDELQVPVLNHLHRSRVIGPATRLIPGRYATTVELVNVDDRYYGFRVAAPKHEWPFYTPADLSWHPTSIEPLTGCASVADVDFSTLTALSVAVKVRLVGIATGRANALRLSGRATLSPGVTLGATNAFSGDKILMLADELDVSAGRPVELGIAFEYGSGLASFGVTSAAAARVIVPGDRRSSDLAGRRPWPAR